MGKLKDLLKGLREREWTYWDGTTEKDYVCRRCETIVLNTVAGCQNCHRMEEKAKERIDVLKSRGWRNE